MDRSLQLTHIRCMRRLICIVIGHHRPAVVVSRYDEGHPVPVVRCDHCGH
jgi:hypothetical protein